MGWLVEQVTARGILVGYVPKNRDDPLIKFVDDYVLIRRFGTQFRGAGIYDAFYPHETVSPPRQFRTQP